MPESAPRPLLCAMAPARSVRRSITRWIEQAISLFEGDAKKLERELTEKMNEAAEELQLSVPPSYVTACVLSRSWAPSSMWLPVRSQSWTLSPLCMGQTRACVCVLHYSAGTLQDKEYTFFHVTESDPAEVLSSFIKQYYAQRNAVAKTVLLSP